MKSFLFIIVMGASAGLSMIRGLVVAGILEPEVFVQYVVIITQGAFISSFLSFGLVEGSIKQFTRISAMGRADQLLDLTTVLVRKLSIRLTICLIPLGLMYLTSQESFIGTLFFSFLVAYGVALTGAVVSMQRSIMKPDYLAAATLIRAILSLILVIMGTYVFGLKGAIGGEIVGSIVGAFSARLIGKISLSKSNIENYHDLEGTKVAIVPAEKGLLLFVAYSVLSVPVYLDRTYVTFVFSESESATYALAILFMSVATVLVNIISQKVGPEIISQKLRGFTVHQLVLHAVRWSIISGVFWILFISSVAIFVNMPVFSKLFEHYYLPLKLLLIIALLGCVQCTSLFEFILLANDKEEKFLISALIYLSLIGVIAVIVYVGKLSLVGFVGCLVLTRFLYFCQILFFIYKKSMIISGKVLRA